MGDELYSNSPDLKMSHHLGAPLTPSNRGSQPSPLRQMALCAPRRSLGFNEETLVQVDRIKSPHKAKQQTKMNESLRRRLEETQKDLDSANLELNNLKEQLQRMQNNEQKLHDLLNRERLKNFSPDKSLPTDHSSSIYDELVHTKGILRDTEKQVEQLESSLGAALDENEDLKKRNESISLKMSEKSQEQASLSQQLKSLQQKDQNSTAFIKRQQETIDELTNEVNQLKELINGESIRLGGSVFGRQGTPVHNGVRLCDISVDDPDCSMENHVGEIIGNDIILDLKESLVRAEDMVTKKSSEVAKAEEAIRSKDDEISKLQRELQVLSDELDTTRKETSHRISEILTEQRKMAKDLEHERSLHSLTVKLVNDLENEKTDLILRETNLMEEFNIKEKELSSKLATLQESLENEEKIISAEKERNHLIVTQSKEERNELLKKLSESIEEVSSMRSTIKDLHGTIHSSEEERESLEMKAQNLESELMSFKAYLPEVEAESMKLKAQVQALSEEVEVKANHLSQLEKALETSKAEVAISNEKLTQVSDSLTKLQEAKKNQFDQHEAEKKQLSENLLKEVENLKNQNNLLAKQVEEKDKELEELSVESKAHFEGLEKSHQEMQHAFEVERQSLKLAIQEQEMRVSDLEETLQESRKSFANLEHDLIEEREKFNSFEKQQAEKDIADALKQKETLHNHLTILEAEKKQLSENLLKEVENLKNQNNLLAKQVEEKDKELEELSVGSKAHFEGLEKSHQEIQHAIEVERQSLKLVIQEQEMRVSDLEETLQESRKSFANLEHDLIGEREKFHHFESVKSQEIQKLEIELRNASDKISQIQAELTTSLSLLDASKIENERLCNEVLLVSNIRDELASDKNSTVLQNQDLSYQLKTLFGQKSELDNELRNKVEQLKVQEKITQEYEDRLKSTEEKLKKSEENLSVYSENNENIKAFLEMENGELASKVKSLENLVESLNKLTDEKALSHGEEKEALNRRIDELQSELRVILDKLRFAEESKAQFKAESDKERSQLLFQVSSLQDSLKIRLDSENAAVSEAQSEKAQLKDEVRTLLAKIDDLESSKIPALKAQIESIQQAAQKDKEDALNAQREKFSAKIKDIGAVAKKQYQKKLVELESNLRSEIEAKEVKLKESSDERSQLRSKFVDNDKKLQELEAKYKAAKEVIKKLQTDHKTLKSENEALKEKLRSVQNESRNLKVHNITADAKIRELQQVDRRGSSLPRSSSTTDSEGFKMPTGMKAVNTPGRTRPGRTQSEATMARRPPLGVGSLFSSEDEAGELFSESYLQDMKSGSLKSFSHIDSGRLSELSRRNSMYPPHLQSCYAAELQTKPPNEFNDDDLRKGKILTENKQEDQVKDLTDKTASLSVDSPAMNTRRHSRISNPKLQSRIHHTVAPKENVIIEYSIPPPPTSSKPRKRRSLSSVSTASNDSDLSFRGNNKRACRDLSIVSYSKPGPPTPARKSNRSINSTADFSMNSSNKSFVSGNIGTSFAIDETPAKVGTRAHDKTPLLDTTNQSKKSSKNVSISSRSLVKTPMTLKKVIYKTFRKSEDKYALKSQEGTPATDRAMPPLRTRKL